MGVYQHLIEMLAILAVDSQKQYTIQILSRLFASPNGGA